MLPYVVETGEGGGPPSHLTVLKLAMLALPVSPTPNGDIPTVQFMGFSLHRLFRSSVEPHPDAYAQLAPAPHLIGIGLPRTGSRLISRLNAVYCPNWG
jgi:hypothetical protein